MKTIPNSWKTGASRDEWYNNRGKPIIFIRIEKVDGTYVRLSNRQIQFAEEGGVNRWYDNKYYKSLSSIDFGLNFMQGMAGAIGQMGKATVTINNGVIDNQKFTDLYALDDLINGKVDIWFVPEKCGDISLNGALQIYKGIITNYSMTCLIVQLILNDYSNIKHKNIPQRIDEFNADHSLSWTIPNESKGKVIPICFGFGTFKAYHMNTVEGTPRYYYVGYDYKDVRTTFKTVLYYWEGSEKRFKTVATPKWTELSYLGGDLHLIRFNVEDLAIYKEMANYLIPSVNVYYHNGQPLALNGSRLADKKKATIADASETRARSVSGGFQQDVWRMVYQLIFKKKQFDLRGNFDLYVVAGISFENDGDVKRWESRFKWTTIEKTQDQSMFDKDGASPEHYYCSWIPTEWINEGHNPNEAISIGLFKKNVSPSELAVTNVVYFSLKPLTNPVTTREAYSYEVSLRQVMLNLPKDFYVRDDFGNNIISDAISFVFTNFLNIPSTDIVFENFASDYKIDGQLYEEKESYEFFSQLANEFGIIFFEDEEGKERFIDITGTNSVYDITENDLVMDADGQLALELSRTTENIYSAFFVDYRKNYATNEYEASKYVTKDNNNLLHIDANDMMRLCYSAYQDYNTEKRMSIKLNYVRDDETAERILGKLVQFYNKKRIVVKIRSSLKIMDIEQGDQVTFNITNVISSTVNFYVIGKTTDHESKTINWVLLESPWTGAGLHKTGGEGVDISDSAAIHLGQAAAEGVTIADSAVAYLNKP